MFKLIREETTAEEAADNQSQWPVRYAAVYSADDSPAHIFVMQLSPNPDLFGDNLSCVANAIQMTDLPALAPLRGSPFYRVASITKLCKDAVHAAAFMEKINEAVQDLANNLYAASQLSEVGNDVIEPSIPTTNHTLTYDADELAVHGNVLTLATF